MKKITLLLISVMFTNCVDIDVKSGDDAKNHLESLMPKKKEASVNLTITDEYPYAHAIVVIESN